MKFYNLQNGVTHLCAIFFILLLTIIGFSCKKSPLDNFKLIISPDVIKYSMLLDIKDAANNNIAPQNIQIGFSGKDAEHIYEISGSKLFKAVDGFLNIGLGPQRTPTTNDPAVFSITINADGYLPITQELNVTALQKKQVVKLQLINISNPPAGMQILQQNIALVNGAIQGQTFIRVSSTGTGKRVLSTQSASASPSVSTFDDGQTNIVFPDGTTFYYYTWVKTGTKTDIVKEPIYSQKNIPLNPGNGTAYYNRLIGYYDKQITYDVGEVKKVKFDGSEIKVLCQYVSGEDINYSAYSYEAYSPFQVSLLNGEQIPEDQILYKSAVEKKLSGLVFTGKLSDGALVMLSPDQDYNWYTSFVLKTTTINSLTGSAIKAGDLIETGIDKASGTTLRTSIIEVTTANGKRELRANTQTNDAGYYYRGIYLADYNYSFNTDYNGSTVADPENFSAYASVRVKSGSQQYPGAFRTFSPNSGIVNLNGKIRSFDPITITCNYGVSYWGQNYNEAVNGNSGNINVFEKTATHIKLEPLVTFEVTNECTSKNKIYRLEGYAVVNSKDGTSDGYANINNGIWRTNGLVQGKDYESVIYVKGQVIMYKNTINKQMFVEHRKNEADVCKLF